MPKGLANKEYWENLKNKYDREKSEVMDLYLLNEIGAVIFIKRIGEGCYSSVHSETGAITQALLDFKPVGMVLVHNHPEGESAPSEADVELTKACQLICSVHNVAFCDHKVYGTDGYYSFYEEGKMGNVTYNYSAGRLVREGKGV